MKTQNCFWLGALVAVALMVPGNVQAQSLEAPSTVSFKPQAASTGKAAIIAGAAIGGFLGMLAGEEFLGHQLDFPHGPDFMIGGGLGAIAGGFIGRSIARNRAGAGKPRKSITVSPVVLKSKKALFVTIPLK